MTNLRIKVCVSNANELEIFYLPLSVVKILAKQLIKQSPEYIELKQHEPKMTFKIARKQIKAIHRIIPWHEVIGI